MIPVSRVVISEESKALVNEVLESGHIAAGPMVDRLEAAFATIAGVQHAVAVSSGTAALVAAMHAAGIGPGDEVITSPFTFVATLNSIIASGARVRFVDVDEDLNINADLLSDALTEATRAVVPVHLYGQPADMSAICEVAAGGGLTIIEDAAQAVGATFRSQPVGSFGVGCFSLYATKNVTTGEGGMVTTNDADIAERVRLFRNQGMRERYRYEAVGFNYRLTDLQAAVGIPQLATIADSNARRVANATRMSEAFAHIQGLVIPRSLEDRSHVFHQYTIRVQPDAPVSREELIDGLARMGVQATVYYPGLVFDHAPFVGHPQVVASRAPSARAAAEQVVSLPVHPSLSESEVDQVIAAVTEVFR